MTERLSVNEITSDQLDRLYDRLETAERDAKDSIAAAVRLTALMGKRSEKAERAAKGQHLRAHRAHAELRTLRSGIRALGGDPTTIQNLWAQISLRNRRWRAEKQRAATYRAAWHSARRRARGRVQTEAALDRVRQLAAAWADPKNWDSVGMRHGVAATALTVTINGPKEY
ncbi:hypothetical protein [Streptomyces sp. NBC_01506]|uniref:hypothetical protein n=1 Tax=Streptomyces sp. NBC_01506 TaxID=2903887 RepID=UPI00386D0E3F